MIYVREIVDSMIHLAIGTFARFHIFHYGLPLFRVTNRPLLIHFYVTITQGVSSDNI